MSALTDIFGSLPTSSAPWNEIPLGNITGSGGLGSIFGSISGTPVQTSGAGTVGVNTQATSGPLNVSDFWRFIIALMIFIVVADSVPGTNAIWWGIISLMAMAAIYYTKTDALLSGVQNYLAGQPYVP